MSIFDKWKKEANKEEEIFEEKTEPSCEDIVVEEDTAEKEDFAHDEGKSGFFFKTQKRTRKNQRSLFRKGGQCIKGL